MRITLGANAGVSVQTENATLWIDLLHTYNEAHFSPLTPELWDAIQEHPFFGTPDVIAFTHRHNDHFSPGLLTEAAERYPESMIILPKADMTLDGSRFEFAQKGGELTYELPARSLLVGARPSCFSVNGDLLYFIRTPHEGRQYEKTLHASIVLCTGGRRLLVTGDLLVDESAVRSVQTALGKLIRENEGAQAADEMQIDAVLATFPWEATNRGRAILTKLAPEDVVLYHIPFAEDDVFGYRAAAKKAVAQGGVQYRLAALTEPFDSVEI